MMSEDLLIEYVTLLSERIRTDRGKQNNRFGNFTNQKKFSFNFFKELESRSDQALYASEFLKCLGQGSSRITFLLNSRQVLKIALNPIGFSQNESEVDLFTNPVTKPLITKIFDFNKDFYWILSEVVKEFTEEKQFEDATNIHWDDFVSDIMEDNARPVTKMGESVLQLMSITHLLPLDLIYVYHWGLSASGKVVILDYGYTHDVKIKHYPKDH